MDLAQHGIKLKEQHRNTRHDAIEKVNEVIHQWEKDNHTKIDEKLVNNITREIMNLKQRHP